jgi:hypothetical protein
MTYLTAWRKIEDIAEKCIIWIGQNKKKAAIGGIVALFLILIVFNG